MKTMTKFIASAFTAAAIFIGTNVKAQTTPANQLRFGIGLETAIPTGNADARSHFMLGGTARLQYGLSDNLALTLTSGYYNFFAKQIVKDGGGRDMGLVPAKLGIKAFVGDGFYLAGEAGAGFEVRPLVEGASKNTKLLLAPGVGYATKSWDFGVRYENLSGSGDNYGLVGLRIAYGFGL